MASPVAVAERASTSHESRRWVAPSVTAAVVGLATVYTGVRDPYQPGFFPACVFYSATGLYCPGCGGLRATHEIVNGDVAAAMDMNPLVVLLILPLGIIGLAWWFLATAGVKVPAFSTRTSVALVLPVILVAFWIVRNIPAFAPTLSPPL